VNPEQIATLSLCDLESLSNAVAWEIEKRNKVRAKIMPKHIPQPDMGEFRQVQAYREKHKCSVGLALACVRLAKNS
jgi:hypothetical protein